MQQSVSLVNLSNQYITNVIGKGWELGPVVIQQEPGSDSLSILLDKNTLDNSFITLKQFKQAVMTDLRIPIKLNISVEAKRGEFDLGPIEFDESVMVWYKESRFKATYVELIFETVAKGKELNIFNGIYATTKRSESCEPLFWASVRKRNIH